MDEATAMSSITYLPSGFGAITTAIKILARLKKQWGIEILEDKEGKQVVFEDQLSIYVPAQYWDDFTKLFEAPLERGLVDLTTYLNETMAEELEQLRDEIKPALTRLLEGKIFKNVDRAVTLFRSNFGVKKYESADVVVTCEDKERKIQRIVFKLLEFYGNDRGNLELLLEAMRGQQNLSTFDVFKDFDFLYGTRIFTEYQKVPMHFEATIDFSYLEDQSILVDDEVVLGKLEDEPIIKVVKDAIFPVGDSFSSSFFRTLKMTIKDMLD